MIVAQLSFKAETSISASQVLHY